MTSLVLFDSDRSKKLVKPGVDWGTGKVRSRSTADRSSSHPSGTFLYKGEPIEQNYRNTDLTLSHVRINDELVPAPLHTTEIGSEQIPLKFPSNHPFASHISEKAVFPTASVDPENRPSTQVDPYVVTHKIRGNPYRREVHYGGALSQQHRQGHWPDQQFMHLSRSVSDLGAAPIYPWPRQIFSPNPIMTMENSGSNIAKNKERVLMETTYQGDYSTSDGLGTHVAFDTTPRLSINEKLKPHFNRTLDPARPIDGVQADQIHGNHRQGSISAREPISSFRWMSEDEKLDDHMRNGTDYINLPASAFPTGQTQTWNPNEVNQKKVEESAPTEIRYLKPKKEVPQLARDHQRTHQQIEAENRLNQLELIRPSDNLTLLNLKHQSLQSPRHARPILPQYYQDYVSTFYDQVGDYVQERSGLYQTNSYRPELLSQSMVELCQQYSDNDGEYQRALKDEQNLNDLLNNAERIQEKSKPNLFQYKAIGDYQTMRNRLVRKFRVPLDSSTVDPKVQEGNPSMIQRETIYGESFNTRKFLQENTLAAHARTDPTALMSTDSNRNLERVRSLNSFPTPAAPPTNEKEMKISDDIVVGPLLPPSPYDELYCNNHINEQTDGYSRRSTYRVYDSPFKADHENLIYKVYPKEKISVAPYPKKANSLPRAAKITLRLPGPEVVSKAKDSVNEPQSTYQHSFQDVSFHEMITPLKDYKPENHHQRLAMKDNDQRFGRLADGRVKQWKLIDLQDRWTKTNAQRQYHQDHPEAVPYVGDATIRTKKEILIADIVEKEQTKIFR